MAAQSCGAHNGRAAPKCWFVHSGARSCGMHRLLQTFGVRTTMIGTRCRSHVFTAIVVFHIERSVVRIVGVGSIILRIAAAVIEEATRLGMRRPGGRRSDVVDARLVGELSAAGVAAPLARTRRIKRPMRAR